MNWKGSGRKQSWPIGATVWHLLKRPCTPAADCVQTDWCCCCLSPRHHSPRHCCYESVRRCSDPAEPHLLSLCTRIAIRMSTPATTRSYFATVLTHRTGLEPRTGASGDLERSWRRTRCNTADVT